MRHKERESILQRWRSAIQRDTRDIDSLDQVLSRAMNDSDVRTDPTLESMIRSEIEHRRSMIESQKNEHRPASVIKQFKFASPPSLPRVPAHTPQDPVRIAFDCMGHTLSRYLEDNNETEALLVHEQMRLLHKESPTIINLTMIDPYMRQIEKLQAHLKIVREQIMALAQQAIVASKKGDDATVAALMLRLSAIQLAYPRLLDEVRLEEIRSEIIHASEQHDDVLRVNRLVERGRVVAAEIEMLAAAVKEFHRIARVVPRVGEEFRRAEAAYLQTVNDVRAHDPEWVAGVILELADLLAECGVPPPGAAGRVDHFLDSIHSSLRRMRAEMRDIETERRESSDGMNNSKT